MRNPIKLLTSAAVAAAFLSASPASAYYQAAYVTNMYNAAGTELVGQIVPECGPQQVQYEQWGTYTQYQTSEFVGYCTENGWVEL